jgi:periplasmic protein TonB
MKKIKNTKWMVRLLAFSAWMSTIALASYATEPDKKIPDEKKSNETFIRSEVPPSLTNGVDVSTGVEGRIEYPEQAIANEIEGLVIVDFTIDATGKAGKYHIVQDIGGSCGRAAVKAIGEIQFLPAVQNGYPVPCKIRVPVRFKLN